LLGKLVDYDSDSDEDLGDTQGKKRPLEDTEKTQERPEKKQKVDKPLPPPQPVEAKKTSELPSLPEFFDSNVNNNNKDKIAKKTPSKEIPPNPPTKINVLIPPQIRSSKPNKVTEDYLAWNTERKQTKKI